ncbi:amino acid transporter [Weissella uvarum]|uniref:glutamate/gamma-aminobutyrate family transporter YjeM n=1 Tax=Weissella uvarum TaxID=1479233 RepID=UPI001960462A|nr:glutamate/gamma-aminobutyrate family transporter YjeM [Weissella uvarum]MBM7617468.1 amino acid transporter [Weissella uvarum]MCM0595647.1 glutamate/gamma-aminobutyrate family transporter YjeM [Weissella uvarum]
MNKKKIGLAALVLMIFSSIFGFGNGPVAFFQMGYASIIWYVLGALLFFLPTSMMYAEFGASYKDSKGGIYTWMEGALGKKTAFIATFIALASWVVWMISVAQKVWIPLSTMFFGHDTTQSWHLFGLTSPQTIGLLAIIFVLVVAFFVTRGMESISKISSVGGMFVMALNVLLLIVSVIVLIANHGQFAEPVTGKSFIIPENPAFQTPFQLISFALYAVFAYAGMEQMGGMMDDIEKPEKTYPRGVMIATMVITFGYALSILLWGVTSNWGHLASMKHVNLGNITYVLMNNLGVALGTSLGFTQATALTIGAWFARFAGLSMFMAYLGSFFVLTYSPLKSFILGSPKEVWPKSVVRLNKAGVPSVAVWIQAGLVVLFIFGIAFGGSDANQLYLILTNMGNVSSTLPYVFLIVAFPIFKKLNNVEHPIVFYKSMTVTWIVTAIVECLIIISMVMTVVPLFMSHDYANAFWTIIGPILFGFIAWVLYEHGERKHGKL